MSIRKHIGRAIMTGCIALVFSSPMQALAAPEIEWNTFLGGTGQHLGYAIDVDSSGNVYTAGLHNVNWNTSLFGDPIDDIGDQGGASDGAVAKLDSSGDVIWYRFFGGSVNDALSGVKVDASGNVYVIGYIFYGMTFTPQATPAPVHAYNGGSIDIMLAKLDSSGDLIWYTYLGSTSNDYVYAIDLDADGNIYIGGESYRRWHADFNNVIGTDKGSDGYQGYIAKIDNDGDYQWHRFLSTYKVYDVAVDTNGFLHTIKRGLFYSGGWNYPAEVGKYNSTTGEQIWSTTLGSGSHDSFGIDVDSTGNVFARGYSNVSWGDPLQAHSGGNDVYVAKLNSSGTLQWNTFFGSAGDDGCPSGRGCGLALDAANNIYITGHSSATWGSPVVAHSGNYDGFVAMLGADGALSWNLFLGGTNQDRGCYVTASPSGDVYATGYTQQTSWGTPNAFPSCYYCHYVAKIAGNLNETPVMTAMSDGAVGEDDPITITGSCTDADAGDTLTVTITQTSGTNCGTIAGTPDVGSSTVSASASCTAPAVNDDTDLVFQLSCSDGTISHEDTVTVTVENNDAPIINDEEGVRVECDEGEDCALPSWTSSDPEGDDTTRRWRQISGESELRFTDNDMVDLVNYRPMRGTYILQYVVDDGSEQTISETVTIMAPNNVPTIASDDDCGITGATFQDSKYVREEFAKDMDVSALFTDYDNDTLAYSWSLDIANPDQAGFISTTSGSSQLRVRMAGDITIMVSVDDGYGGITTEEIVLSIPVPDVVDDDMNLELASWGFVDANTITVNGTLRSPVWPVVILNGATTSTISLTSAVSSSISSKADISSAYDTYSFTATGVPVGDNASQLSVGIYTSVNGVNTSLSDQTAQLSDDITDAGVSIAAAGCSLSGGSATAMQLTWMFPMLAGYLSAVIVLRRRKLRR